MCEYPWEFFPCFIAADLETLGSKLLTSFSPGMLHGQWIVFTPVLPHSNLVLAIQFLPFPHPSSQELFSMWLLQDPMEKVAISPGSVASYLAAWHLVWHLYQHRDLHRYSGSNEQMKKKCAQGRSAHLAISAVIFRFLTLKSSGLWIKHLMLWGLVVLSFVWHLLSILLIKHAYQVPTRQTQFYPWEA